MAKTHLLYIAFFFPPSRSSGVYRALATVQAFTREGWDVTVLTADERFFDYEIGSVDRSLLELIPDGVEVVRVPFSFQRGISARRLQEVGWFQGNFPLLETGLRRRFDSAVTAVEIFRGRSPLSYRMDDRYLAWIEPAVAAAERLARRREFDHVLATGNPYSAFEAARIIATLQSVPFTIDYRDPWAFDMRTNSKAKLSAPTFAAEKRIIEQAHACVQVNDAIASAYEDLYPEMASKQHVVVNGYDVDSIPAVRPPSGGPLRFGMLGTVTDLWPLAQLFEAWHLVRPTLPAGSTLRLGGHLGYFGRQAEQLSSTFPDAEAGFEYVGPITKAGVGDFYGELDAVVVTLFGGPMVTAGKVLEVAALGLPIICVQGEDGGARQFYRNHPLATGVDPDPDQIVLAFRSAAEMCRTVTVDQRMAVRASMAKYERLAAMRRMVELVSSAPESELVDA